MRSKSTSALSRPDPPRASRVTRRSPIASSRSRVWSIDAEISMEAKPRATSTDMGPRSMPTHRSSLSRDEEMMASTMETTAMLAPYAIR
eukprot:scaffold93465_cov30-Tisochrysis_lutea.AAC.2